MQSMSAKLKRPLPAAVHSAKFAQGRSPDMSCEPDMSKHAKRDAKRYANFLCPLHMIYLHNAEHF